MTIQLLKKNRKSLILSVFTVSLFLDASSVLAQLQNNGILHVKENGVVFVKSGDFNFGLSSETTTSKSTTYFAEDGKILLGTSAVFSTDGASAKFVNGYAGTFSTDPTILTIGAGSNYAPVKVVPNSNIHGVHAAYFNAAPLNIFPGLDASVSQVANSEYWIIKGENSILSLSWRPSSNLGTFSYPDVTIVGYKNGNWEAIPSAIDTNSVFGGISVLSSHGSISSLNPIILNNYDAFAIGEKSMLSTGEFTVDNETIVFINNDFLHIKSKINIEEINLFDVSGRLIISYKNDTPSTLITVPFNHASGMYILKTKLNNGQLHTQKILKN